MPKASNIPPKCFPTSLKHIATKTMSKTRRKMIKHFIKNEVREPQTVCFFVGRTNILQIKPNSNIKNNKSKVYYKKKQKKEQNNYKK